MSHSDLNVVTIPLPIYQNYRILCSSTNDYTIRRTIMIPISEQEEKSIDNIRDSILKFKRGNLSFSVKMKDIYCYGEVDFTNKDDLNQIDSFDFLDHLDTSGIYIWSRYDYETHSCKTSNKRLLWTETWHPSVVAQIAHGYLGKPQRILIFNQYVRK